MEITLTHLLLGILITLIFVLISSVPNWLLMRLIIQVEERLDKKSAKIFYLLKKLHEANEKSLDNNHEINEARKDIELLEEKVNGEI